MYTSRLVFGVIELGGGGGGGKKIITQQSIIREILCIGFRRRSGRECDLSVISVSMNGYSTCITNMSNRCC